MALNVAVGARWVLRKTAGPLGFFGTSKLSPGANRSQERKVFSKLRL